MRPDTLRMYRKGEVYVLLCTIAYDPKGMKMPILMKAEVHGQTLEGYSQVFNGLAPQYRAAPGFVAHMSHPIEGGWCVMDVWDSKDSFQQFFSQHVVHRLPDNVRPKISFQPLHDVFIVATGEVPSSDA